ESLVVTGKARAAIRRATRDAVRSQYAGLGRQIVTRAFERAQKAFSDDRLKTALPRLARQSIDDVLAAVGRGEMFSGDVVKAVYPDFKEERKAGIAAPKTERGWFGLKKAASLVFKVPGADGEDDAQAIPIRGLGGDLPVRFAPNGGAVPGDRIVGILTPGEGITIYPIQSPALMDFDDQPERWLDVRWDIDDERKDFFPARIIVNALNEPGALGVISTVIGDAGANIDHIEFVSRSQDFRDIVIDVQVIDLSHLNAIMTQLKAKSVVSKVERVNG
ncbi:MAG: pyrophosphokinae rsh, partial [Pseudomonadota bacterium]